MKLSEVKELLNKLDTVQFELENGAFVPEHFHVTEIGAITKHFIDCGSTVRIEKVVNFQLWNANDVDHRLKPEKLLKIIALSEKVLGLDDLEIEVEYQSDTIGKYALDFNGKYFVLRTKRTNCLAQDKCGIPAEQLPVQLINNVQPAQSCCTPGAGCC